MRKTSFIIILYFLLMHFSYSKTEASLPRFGTIKVTEANVRNGPNAKYPIKWTFTKAKEPIEIINEFEKWKKVRDFDGDEGWIHDSLISNKRRAIINKNIEVKIHQKMSFDSPLVAIAKPLVRVDVIHSNQKWCHIKVNQYKGWMLCKDLWGVYPHEKF